MGRLMRRFAPALVAVGLALAGACAPAVPLGPASNVAPGERGHRSAEEAVTLARGWLHEHGIPADDREPVVEVHPERFRVVFRPPPQVRAGDIALSVDRATGAISDVSIER